MVKGTTNCMQNHLKNFCSLSNFCEDKFSFSHVILFTQKVFDIFHYAIIISYRQKHFTENVCNLKKIYFIRISVQNMAANSC